MATSTGCCILTDRCRFAKEQEFDKTARQTGMKIKEPNTVVEQWPTSPKLRFGQEGAEEEFVIALAATYNSWVRYVEWIHAG